MRKPFPFNNVLITGASSGLGEVLAQMLLERGCRVWGTSRDAARIKSPGLTPLTLDLSDPESVHAFANSSLHATGPLDLLINNAGAGLFGRVEELAAVDARAQLDLLLTGPIELTRAVLPGMLERQHGCIANVSSLAALFPLPCMTLYSAAKAGLSAFSRSLAYETAGRNVHVVDFQPGDFRTGFNKHMQRAGSDLATWESLERHLASGPDADHIARRLVRIIEKQRSGTWRAGSFFQATLAPLGQRMLPAALMRTLERRYHNGAS